jgi:ferritin-like metal-binding protein YciE
MEASLKKHSENEDLSAAARQLASAHLEETRRHASEVEMALKSLNADTSSLKTGIGVMGQMAKGLTTSFARDERIKDLLDAYSMEHFEIACYLALAKAAILAGLPEVAETCQRIIADEERMAGSLKASLPMEVSNYLVSD